MQNAKSGNHKEYIKALIAFTILVENVSLFSQFATILYFCRFEGIMKNVANIIAWTSVDEQTHANAGIWIIQQIFAEDPDFLDRNDVNDIIAIVKESIDIESDVLDWIFETGEFPTMSKADLIAYMKQRLNDSLRQLQYVPIVFTDYETANASNLKWFEEEIFANSLDDFFAKRPVDYTKHDKPVTENDLF
jgi:ribonucleoside-diphosphate reductase beta chain